MSRPIPRLQALTVERELSFEYDDIGMGESDDEVGDDETVKVGTGIHLILKWGTSITGIVNIKYQQFYSMHIRNI